MTDAEERTVEGAYGGTLLLYFTENCVYIHNKISGAFSKQEGKFLDNIVMIVW